MADLVPRVDLNDSYNLSFTPHSDPRITTLLSHWGNWGTESEVLFPLELDEVLAAWALRHCANDRLALSKHCLDWCKLIHLSLWDLGFSWSPTLSQICGTLVCPLWLYRGPKQKRVFFGFNTLQISALDTLNDFPPVLQFIVCKITNIKKQGSTRGSTYLQSQHLRVQWVWRHSVSVRPTL